ncbi:hypothetical protein [Streptomyces sp. MBT53]|uniref:hypothetical protein n=2 Tax=unclassified Streptomyces TaxID=2593676 RepID=UPI001F48CFB9|nr:hypothetical protein [Streptomyces sp. MBT53]
MAIFGRRRLPESLKANAMMNPDQPSARPGLTAALDGLAAVFGGMTAHPDEHNCECHWGSAEELAQLKVPDTELDLDLLDRTWRAPDWSDHASVLRRILPQLATALVKGSIETHFGSAEVGRSFARGHWQQWPTAQAEAVRAFLHAWWADTLTDPDPAVPAYEVLALITEASATLTPWLTTWETLTGRPADDHLAEAATKWEYDLLGDQLPWDSWENEEETRAELTTWLVRTAPARLRTHGASEELLHRIRLLGLTGDDRWEELNGTPVS